MAWTAILELIIKFIPTLIKSIMDIIKTVKGSKDAAGLVALNKGDADHVCNFIDKVICALDEGKTKIQKDVA